MLKRILLFTGLTLVVMLLFIMLATSTVLNNGFARIERGFMTRNIARVQNAFSEQEKSLGAAATDWATWDATYRFVLDRNTGFRETNLRSEILTNLNVDVIAFLNRDGTLAFGATLDKSQNVTPRVPAGLMEWLGAHPFMARLAERSAHAEGIIVLPGGPLMAAARPILDSQGNGPIHGTLLMCRFLDPDLVSQISRGLMLAVALLPLPAGGPAAPLNPVIDASRETIISGSAVLTGADGAPALIMRVTFPRDIHAQAVVTYRYFIALILVIGVVFGAVVLIVIQTTVLSRLQRLSADVLSIGTGAEPTRRVTVKGTDQIAYLGAAINGMLDALEGSSSRLSQSEQRNRALLDAIPEVILRVTRDGTIIDARFPPHVSLAGDQDALVGSTLRELAQRFPQLKGRPVEEVHEALARVVQAAEPVTLEFSLDVGQGEQHFEARVAASGEAEAIIVARETTAKKRVQEAQRHEILLKEIHHRVKNNLQVISSLLSLQATSARDERVRSLLDESRHRVRSVALIHERLYRGGTVGTGYAQYVRDLADQLVRFYKGESGQVRIDIDVDDIPMDMDMSVPVGLIINELLTNSLAHAFPKDRHGSIRVSMKRAGGGRIEIGISDDGVGFPPEIDYRNPSSLGLRIVNMLAQQLKATLEVDGRDGTRFRVLFPAD
ncbi:MAG TPA: CHASE4 domain-containing protein [Spirochaetia bacterium]|nr:CHASE4 domain-containing protein [Spirochaetia bacterium]